MLPTVLETMAMFTLAAAGGQCILPEAPVINIKPTTANIQYDFSKTDAELTAMKSNTISPYGIGVDLVTKGLRHDKPEMSYNIEFGSSQNPKNGTFCVWYKQINVDIKLSPKIFIAKGYNKGKCGQFILEHEKKHVLVDRKVMNKYSKMMGQSIQNAVNLAGAQGPYNYAQINEIRESMQKHIESAINSVLLLMKNEMNQKQQAIDSKEEYDEGAKVCRDLTNAVNREKSRY